jgi:hypothetical protein
VTLAKVLNADRSDGVELQQPCGGNPGLFPRLANSCIAWRFTIFPTTGDSLPYVIVGALEDGIFEIPAHLPPVRQHEDLKRCASHTRNIVADAHGRTTTVSKAAADSPIPAR